MLRDCTNFHKVKKTLATFPTDIEYLYHKSWQRILSRAPGKTVMARNTLAWVVFSTRSLIIGELWEAVLHTQRPTSLSCIVWFKRQRSLGSATDWWSSRSKMGWSGLSVSSLCLLSVPLFDDRRPEPFDYTAKDTLERLITEEFQPPRALLSAV
ncbi:hypothetical protein BKA70DRAFT_175526 [Coprinopsis sp. MPI-PUGE-AT-0042]|nr:hypothetical protein BKA70DRAFT_175526 [Coprinopsis sp. MPI-PUGE-AT-0042]